MTTRVARRLLRAIYMAPVPSRDLGKQLRFLGSSVLGLVISLVAAVVLIRRGQGYGQLLLCLGLFFVAARYFRTLARIASRLNQARHLEAALQDTGRALEKLHGYETLRRLVGTPGKQEHVVVGPNGVFVVLTRTGRSLSLAPHSRNKTSKQTRGVDLVEESRIEAACVAEKICRRLGYRPRIQPVLCFPQGLVAVGEQRRGVLIVTTQRLTPTIEARPAEETLSPKEVETMVEALVEPLPPAIAPSPAYLRLMPRPLPRR